MLDAAINLHSYWVFNGAIALSYLVMRLIFGFYGKKIAPFNKLKISRFSLILTVTIFVLMPIIIEKLPFAYNSTFHFEPIVKNAALTFLDNHKVINNQLDQIKLAPWTMPINLVLMLILLGGGCFFLLKYLKNIRILKKIIQSSFCRHKINNTTILFSQKAETPFCCSFLKNHFIVIPNIFLEKSNIILLAIRHELQHIRQGDTRWLHFLMIIQIFCFWNPFMKPWINWMNELQEFSCDEALVLHKKTTAVAYAQCLLDAAGTLTDRLLPAGALGVYGLSKSILYRRVNMLFNYNKNKTKKLAICVVYVVSLFTAVSVAYAFNSSSLLSPLSEKQIETIITESDLNPGFQISATPEVVNEINNIRASKQARSFIQESLHRMKHYQPSIQVALDKQAMPKELLALPLVESGYKQLPQKENPAHAAGIWQIIPETAKHLGLVINEKRDDRLNTQLSTNAALTYLHANYEQFNDWMLAVLAYEYGEKAMQQLVEKVGSKNVWVLSKSTSAPKDMKKFVFMFDATVIIMQNPSLISN